MSVYNFAIGNTIDALVNVEELWAGFPAPRSEFFPSEGTISLANKTDLGIGRPMATWHWGFLRNMSSSIDPFRDTLHAYCPNDVSSVVYIRTMTNNNLNEYKAYRATMHWPTPETQDASRRIDFTIKFTNLVLTAEPPPPGP